MIEWVRVFERRPSATKGDFNTLQFFNCDIMQRGPNSYNPTYSQTDGERQKHADKRTDGLNDGGVRRTRARACTCIGMAVGSRETFLHRVIRFLFSMRSQQLSHFSRSSFDGQMRLAPLQSFV